MQLLFKIIIDNIKKNYFDILYLDLNNGDSIYNSVVFLKSTKYRILHE